MLEGEIVTLRDRAAFGLNARLELAAGRFQRDTAVLWVQEWRPFKLSTLRVKAGQEILIRGHLIRVLEVNPHNVRPYLRLEVGSVPSNLAPLLEEPGAGASANSLSGRRRNYQQSPADHEHKKFSWRNRNARQ